MPVLSMVLIWPAPALLVWGVAWGLFALLTMLGSGILWAAVLPCGLGVLSSLLGQTWWRRLMIGLGFPLSLALSGLVVMPAWTWLLPLGLLMLIYPINAWRDAPLFPTPQGALLELPRHAALPVGARVMDAGCGLGQGLAALHSAYPQAQLHGLEWSWPLRWMCALRCPWARVRQGDIWNADWSSYDLVYLFQRPESMARAADKAQVQLRHGAWLVSLEFEATTLKPCVHYRSPSGKMVWLYQAPFLVLTGD
jgi:SAM-dependent methyltransferase